MEKSHSFHIPVMGVGYTVDTPLKVAHYGMDSVMAIGDDHLLEQLRKAYCFRYKLHYEPITDKQEDYRAKRISAYLNLINKLARQKFEQLLNAMPGNSEALQKYFSMLPDASTLKQEFNSLTAKHFNKEKIKSWLKNNLTMGSIDVNIMTKVDRPSYRGDEQLPTAYNNAHTALRGFANSTLNSSVIFSAGMNPRLYGYLTEFEDFDPDEKGEIKKKIVLKVSDFRSAFIQGKFLAKKGLWVSEYRIESGLNCGGHAFATDGYLMGPILAEFRDKREELIQSVHEVFTEAFAHKKRTIPPAVLPVKITTQGGVGTAEEHQFLLDHYGVDSVGWGTPFLLVPEVTNVDSATLHKLATAREDDLYLSDISPLGVPFNSLKGNTKDLEKQVRIEKGRPGSPCVKEYLAFNTEFTEKPICVASRQYQNLKIKELDKEQLTAEEHQKRWEKIVDKTCICTGLSTSVLFLNEIDTDKGGNGVSICPGPNMAYFSKEMSLNEITDHIYGRENVLTRTDRPNMFIKELNIYIDYLKKKMEEAKGAVTDKQQPLLTFAKNLQEGIDHYHRMFSSLQDAFSDTKADILRELETRRETLSLLLPN